MPKDPHEVGAISNRKTAGGRPYLALTVDLEGILTLTGGDVGIVPLVAFASLKTTDDHQPDYFVFYLKDRVAADEQDARPNTPGVQNVDYGEIPGTASYRRRRARDDE